MLIVLAHDGDMAARALVDRWAAHGARLLTCDDLSSTGWRHYPGVPADSAAVVGGQIVPVREIAGVLTRLPALVGQELVRIMPEERRYAAAEMTAFLAAWLAELPCPVLNRPTPISLCGPGWRPEQWTAAASHLGIPVAPRERVAALSRDGASLPDRGAGLPEAPGGRPVSVTVVGRRCLGAIDDTLASQARRLADAAGVDLLVVQFGGSQAGARFLGATPWPDIADGAIADAILDYFSIPRGAGAPA